MNEIDEIEQIITMGYGNPRERAEQIWALFSVSKRDEYKKGYKDGFNDRDVC